MVIKVDHGTCVYCCITSLDPVRGDSHFLRGEHQQLCISPSRFVQYVVAIKYDLMALLEHSSDVVWETLST